MKGLEAKGLFCVYAFALGSKGRIRHKKLLILLACEIVLYSSSNYL